MVKEKFQFFFINGKFFLLSLLNHYYHNVLLDVLGISSDIGLITLFYLFFYGYSESEYRPLIKIFFVFRPYFSAMLFNNVF